MLPLLVPVVAAALLLPLVTPVFLGFLAGPTADLLPGLAGFLLRAGFVVVGATTLDVYAALVRGPDRSTLDLHPVDAGQVVAYELVRVATVRAWWPVALGVLLAPIVPRMGGVAWAVSTAALTEVWLLSLTASALTHLGAVAIAESPRAAPLLDLIRGANPRAQAAFLYAPGAVLAATGGVVFALTQAVTATLSGHLVGASALALTPALAAALWLPVPRLARATWFRASAVIADIDARYSALEQTDDGTRVYLDWTTRFLPAGLVPYALKDLRHGWRGRRTWLTGAWGVGVGAALAGWQGGAHAPEVALAVAVLGSLSLGLVGVMLERDDPAFLRQWMPADRRRVTLARALAVFAWLQGAVWLAVPTVWLRHGLTSALTVCVTALLASTVAAALSALCSQRPRLGLLVYPLVAAAVAATLVTLSPLGGAQ